MTVIADRRDFSRDPGRPDPGGSRAATKRGDEARFYLGVVAIVALVIFGTLAVVAIIPIVIPGATTVAITSGSMMPRLHPGDAVIAVDHDNTAIADGTIVVFEDPARGDLVTHRIVGTDADGNYITRGDANGIDDVTPIPPENVRGVGRWVVPYVGLLRVWLAEGRWLLAIMIIAAVGAGVFTARCATSIECDPWAEGDDATNRDLEVSSP